jgi:hypothetical protein
MQVAVLLVSDVEHQSTITIESINKKKVENENVVVVALTSLLKCGKKRKMRMNAESRKKRKN